MLFALVAVRERNRKAWRARKSPLVARWAQRSKIKGDKNRVVLLRFPPAGSHDRGGGLGQTPGERPVAVARAGFRSNGCRADDSQAGPGFRAEDRKLLPRSPMATYRFRASTCGKERCRENRGAAECDVAIRRGLQPTRGA